MQRSLSGIFERCAETGCGLDFVKAETDQLVDVVESIGLAPSWVSGLARCIWSSRLGGERSSTVSECLEF